MPSKAQSAIMELLEANPMSSGELVGELDYSRKTVQKWLAVGVSDGKLQRTLEDQGSRYSIISNGASPVWNWTQMREWRKHDGPIENVYIENPPGHLCSWSCNWITPDGIKKPAMPDDAESVWWESRDVIARYGEVVVGANSLTMALASAPFPENLGGAALNIARQCLGIARTSLYGQRPFLHPTTIRRTGNARIPLVLDLGSMRVQRAYVSFRPGFSPPGAVSKVLIAYAGFHINPERLHDEEWVQFDAMSAAFREMDAVT